MELPRISIKITEAQRRVLVQMLQKQLGHKAAYQGYVDLVDCEELLHIVKKG